MASLIRIAQPGADRRGDQSRHRPRRGGANRGARRRRPAPRAAFTVGPAGEQTVYLIPVEVEDHLLGYVQVVADFADFARPLGSIASIC